MSTITFHLSSFSNSARHLEDSFKLTAHLNPLILWLLPQYMEFLSHLVANSRDSRCPCFLLPLHPFRTYRST